MQNLFLPNQKKHPTQCNDNLIPCCLWCFSFTHHSKGGHEGWRCTVNYCVESVGTFPLIDSAMTKQCCTYYIVKKKNNKTQFETIIYFPVSCFDIFGTKQLLQFWQIWLVIASLKPLLNCPFTASIHILAILHKLHNITVGDPSWIVLLRCRVLGGCNVKLFYCETSQLLSLFLQCEYFNVHLLKKGSRRGWSDMVITQFHYSFT